MSTTLGSNRRRAALAAGLIGAAVVAFLALPGVAVAVSPLIESPPDADARCDTIPTSYPGNGVPVPSGAACAVVMTYAGAPVAEVWAWGDDAGMHWYNYLAEGYTADGGYALTMCATDDESAEGVTYECTTDSTFLLFTMSNMFVTWPAVVEGDHYYCESVDVVGPDGVASTGHACDTLSEQASGEEAPIPPPTTPPTEPAPPPTESFPTESPPTTPVDAAPDEPTGDGETSAPPGVGPGPLPPSAGVPTPAVPTAPDAEEPRGRLENAFGPGPDSTPIASESVALVEGTAFPVALVFALAGALALGGVGVLAGPGAIAAIRRRT